MTEKENKKLNVEEVLNQLTVEKLGGRYDLAVLAMRWARALYRHRMPRITQGLATPVERPQDYEVLAEAVADVAEGRITEANILRKVAQLREQPAPVLEPPPLEIEVEEEDEEEEGGTKPRKSRRKPKDGDKSD